MDATIKQALNKAVEQGKLTEDKMPERYKGVASKPEVKPKPEPIEIPLKNIPITDGRVDFLENAVLNLMMEGM